LDLDPQLAPAHYGLGITWQARGRLDLAVAAYEKAIALDPNYALPHYNLGVALQRQGKYGEATVAYRKTIQLQPGHAEAHCNLGLMLQHQGQLRKALESLRRGHELGSKDPRWKYPSAQWAKDVERLVELEGHLPRVLAGERAVADARERLAYAGLFCRKRLFEQAGPLYQRGPAGGAAPAGGPPEGHPHHPAPAPPPGGAGAGGGR